MVTEGQTRTICLFSSRVGSNRSRRFPARRKRRLRRDKSGSPSAGCSTAALGCGHDAALGCMKWARQAAPQRSVAPAGALGGWEVTLFPGFPPVTPGYHSPVPAGTLQPYGSAGSVSWLCGCRRFSACCTSSSSGSNPAAIRSSFRAFSISPSSMRCLATRL